MSNSMNTISDYYLSQCEQDLDEMSNESIENMLARYGGEECFYTFDKCSCGNPKYVAFPKCYDCFQKLKKNDQTIKDFMKRIGI